MLHYRDESGELVLPLPSLPGAHQVENAGLAISMLRHQHILPVSTEAMVSGIMAADWPARLHRLRAGPLTGSREVWLDGGHNPSAGAMLGTHFYDQKLHLVIGMIEGKDPVALIKPLAPSLASITVVPVPGHKCHAPEAFGAAAGSAPDAPSALSGLPDDNLPVLIAGSLYLAGEVLRLNDEIPD
jgi:dihydrofolate synthase/folylpolyglutamate synthase